MNLSNPLKRNEKILPVTNMSDGQPFGFDSGFFAGDYFSAR
ncbi:hypothetical protein [Arcicella aurantiaca]|nr:hypothetical protein [Arcicella aurantiaca]